MQKQKQQELQRGQLKAKSHYYIIKNFLNNDCNNYSTKRLLMAKRISQIKENYPHYKSLCFAQKTTTTDPVKFTRDKPSRPDTLYHESPLVHSSIPTDISLLAEQKKMNSCSYKFQIRCKDFCEQPLFRFDSDGAAHRNDELPLSKQQVTTPHFNSFDSEGRSIAYKTTELENVDYAALKDMIRFFQLFCQECFIVNEISELPGINSGDVRLLEFDLHNEDLLSDVNFEV
jgi:hypothetical protein